MKGRTSFDLIAKNTGRIILSVRSKDCFGNYSNHRNIVDQYKNQIFRYYLPEYYVTPEPVGNKYALVKHKDTKNYDFLAFNDEEIAFYLEQLNRIGIGVKRVEDTQLDIWPVEHSYLLEEGLSPTTRCVTLEFDFSDCRSIKEPKFRLFLTRYLINVRGNKILRKAMDYHKEYPELDFWEIFITSEFMDWLEGKRGNYVLFSLAHYVNRYFTIEDFIQDVVLSGSGEFDIFNSMYYNSKYYPYVQVYADTTEKQKENTRQGRLSQEAFLKIVDNLDLPLPKFIEFWKNYDWGQTKEEERQACTI